MSQAEKDPGIMLFGRKIPLPESQILTNSGAMGAGCSIKKTEAETTCAKNSEKQENYSDLRDGKEDSQQYVQENDATENPKPVEDNVETSSSGDRDKIMKKPDKILRCPRCKSMDTKFCYFNNYNVNQPRHFCKNCQRYWTAGGTMRNVPVGAGRRKHKHLASQFQHIIVTPDGGVPVARLESKDSSVFSSLADNTSVLKFGLDNNLMGSMVNLRDQKRCADANSINCAEYGEESSLCGSSLTNVSTQRNNEPSEQNNNNIPNWFQCYPYPPWVLPWNPSNWNNVQGICTPSSTIPVQLVPAATYWSGTPAPMVWGSSGTGTVSIGSSNPSCLSPSSSASNSCCSGNGSKILVKHTRDKVSTDEEKPEKFVLAPKAPKIDSDASKVAFGFCRRTYETETLGTKVCSEKGAELENLNLSLSREQFLR